MIRRTFDGAWLHHERDRWDIPYSYSCPYLDEKGKHCQGAHGYRRHPLIVKTHSWKLCGPCWRKMKGQQLYPLHKQRLWLPDDIVE